MSGIRHCKLRKRIQRRLLEFFVLEVTACSAADFLGIQPKTAILFYKKIRQVIVHHLALEANEMFDEKNRANRQVILVATRRGEKRPAGDWESSCSWHSQEKRQGLYSGCQ